MFKQRFTEPGQRERDEREILRAWRWLPLRSVALGLSPGRVLLGVFTLVVASLVGRATMLWEPEGMPPVGSRLAMIAGDTVHGVVYSLTTWSASTGDAAFGGLEGAPETIAGTSAVGSWLVLLVMLLVLGIGAVAIARSAGVAVAHGRPESWPVVVGKGLSFAPRGYAWILLSLGLPVMGFLLIGLAGRVLLGGGGSVPGAVLFGPLWLVGIALFAALLLVLLAVPLVVGALGCETTDGLDALQRGLAFVVAKPVGTVAWLLTCLVVIALAGVLAAWIANTGLDVGVAIAQGWTERGDMAGRFVMRGLEHGLDDQRDMATARVIAFWREFAGLLVGGFVFAMLASACATVYLRLRLVIDGQSPGDL